MLQLLGSSHQFPIVASIVITLTVTFPLGFFPLWIFFYNFTPVMTHFNHSVGFHTDPFRPHSSLLTVRFKGAKRNRFVRPTNPTSNATLYQKKKGKSKGRDLCSGFFSRPSAVQLCDGSCRVHGSVNIGRLFVVHTSPLSLGFSSAAE